MCVSCERTGRTRFRPSRWPSFSASYCTRSNSHFGTTLTPAWSRWTSNVCQHLQISRLKLLFDTWKSLQTGQQWLKGALKSVIKSFRQEQMHPVDVWTQLQLGHKEFKANLWHLIINLIMQLSTVPQVQFQEFADCTAGAVRFCVTSMQTNKRCQTKWPIAGSRGGKYLIVSPNLYKFPADKWKYANSCNYLS